MAEKESSSSEQSPLATASYVAGIPLLAASIGAGFYHGYCEGHGIPFGKEKLELALIHGPTILGAIGFGIVGLIKGGVIAATFGQKNSTLERIAKGTVGAVAGGALGGAIGGILGKVNTLIGYGIGYSVGHFTR